jgi:prolyl oligopeptidase
VDAQNAITFPFINACPKRQAIHDRLKQLWDYPKYSCPVKKGDKYYFYMNTGLQNQRYALDFHNMHIYLIT